MRPLELTVQGFKSYRERCSFNFEGRGLFGIVGPTGAGKSSMLDALIYCLYGKTPRLERETKKLINSQEDEAKLQLSFEMDGVAWEVTRVVRRKGQSQVLLQRLDGTGDPVTGDRNVNDELPEILGLDFGAFCASVCLSQGEFDRFLKATATERVQILKGVFALDKVDALREASKGHARLINDQVRILQGTLEALPEDPEALIDQAKKALTGAREKFERVREAVPAVTAAEVELERSAREEHLIGEARNATGMALRAIPSGEALEELVALEDSGGRAAAKAEEALTAADAAVETAEQELASIEKRGRGPDWCSQVESAIRSFSATEKDKAGHERVAAGFDKEVAEAEAAAVKSQEAFQSAEADFNQARLGLSEAEQRHAAHFLRAELRAGAPCPVCEQEVSKVPGVPEPPVLDKAKSAVIKAEAVLSKEREAVDLARRQEARAQERRRNAEDTTNALAQKLEASASALAALTGGAGDPAADLEKARLALEDVKAKLQGAAAARHRSSLDLKQASAGQDKARAETLKTVTLLSQVCGQLGVDSALIQEEGLVQTAKRLNERALLDLEELARRTAELTAAVQGARRTVANFRERFGAAVQEAPAEVLGRAMSDVQSLENRIEELTAALARRKLAETGLNELSARKALYDRLSGDLTDAKFTAYLLTEQTRVLCELASEKFRELTGHYTFDFDEHGNITVVDDRNGSVRSPQDTLSGGESFLASLSLALALAETVANRGGRLECFFLDEGFGSLDAEALDRALDGIQSLAEPGRLIGLISHVGGIQSQLGDLIVLERNPDGSTTVAQDGGPIGYLPSLI